MIFRSYRKRKAIESYHTILAKRLRGLHGKREHYAPADVVATARAYNLSETYLCYALAIYCDRADFNAYHAERGDVACSYDRLWRELNAMVTGSAAALRPDANRDERVSDVGEALGDLGGGGADGGAHEAICGFDGVSHGGGYEGGGFDGGGSCD